MKKTPLAKLFKKEKEIAEKEHMKFIQRLHRCKNDKEATVIMAARKNFTELEYERFLETITKDME